MPLSATSAQRRDPDWRPPWALAVPLGLQHVLAMFVANVTPALLVAGAAGLAPGDPATVRLIQMCMLCAGLATLLQTVGFGPVGARLPILQGTSFAFVPLMLPLVAGQGEAGLALLAGGVLAGGLFHMALAPAIGRLRFLLPPLVTGLVVLMIGLSLVRVGIQYAAGGAGLAGTPAYGSAANWAVAGLVLAVTLALMFLGRGAFAMGAALIGILAGWALAAGLGMADFAPVAAAPALALPAPLPFGVAFSAAAVLGFALMAAVSAVETVGDVEAITRGGAARDATDREIVGATWANGLGTALAGGLGGLPNTSFSQNVGLIAMTGLMSRHVVSLGALFLILCGLVPKLGALIASIPLPVLGGGVIVMFGMVCAAGLSILSQVRWSRRNMGILAVSLALGLGLQLEPGALQHLPELPRVLLATGLLPAAALAILLNLLVPETAAA